LSYFQRSEGFFDTKRLDKAERRPFWLVFICFLSKVFEKRLKLVFSKKSWARSHPDQKTLKKPSKNHHKTPEKHPKNTTKN